MSSKYDVLNVLCMTEAEMMEIDTIILYKAFYAMPTRVSPAMCDLSTGKGLERLNPKEREVAERIARIVQLRCPVPKIERWKSWTKPAANETKRADRLRVIHY
jgi:hypothetical protein